MKFDFDDCWPFGIHFACLLACRVLFVTLYHSSYVESDGHVKLSRGVLACIDCLIVRCLC